MTTQGPEAFATPDEERLFAYAASPDRDPVTDLEASVQHIHRALDAATAAAPPIPAERKQQIWEHLMKAPSIPASGSPFALQGPGQAAPSTRGWEAPSARSQARWGVAVNVLLAAALILAIGGGAWRIGGGLERNSRRDAPHESALLFAPGATPEATPAVKTEEEVLEIAVPGVVLPAGIVNTWSTLNQLDPGVTRDYPPFDAVSPTVAVIWVQSGTMALVGEPLAVHRAVDGATPGATPAADELHLGPGDAAVLDLGPGRFYPMHTVGPEPLVFLGSLVMVGKTPMPQFPSGWEFLDHHTLLGVAELPTSSTVTIRLSRATLNQGETLAQPEGQWHNVVQTSSVVTSVPGPIRNIGGATTTVLVTTATFTPEAATPMASPVAQSGRPSGWCAGACHAVDA